MHIKTGDTILFAKWGGTEVKIEGKDYIIMKEGDVLAIKTN
jgi:chaperonin GroES